MRVYQVSYGAPASHIVRMVVVENRRKGSGTDRSTQSARAMPMTCRLDSLRNVRVGVAEREIQVCETTWRPWIAWDTRNEYLNAPEQYVEACLSYCVREELTLPKEGSGHSSLSSHAPDSSSPSDHHSHTELKSRPCRCVYRLVHACQLSDVSAHR